MPHNFSLDQKQWEFIQRGSHIKEQHMKKFTKEFTHQILTEKMHIPNVFRANVTS